MTDNKDYKNLNIVIEDESITDDFESIVCHSNFVVETYKVINRMKQIIWEKIYEKYNLDQNKTYAYNPNTKTITCKSQNKITKDAEDSEKVNAYINMFEGECIGLYKLDHKSKQIEAELINHLCEKYKLNTNQTYKITSEHIVESNVGNDNPVKQNNHDEQVNPDEYKI